MSERTRDETMWYCRGCDSWLGTKIDVCFECGTPRPRRPLRAADVDHKPSYEVTRLDRLKATLGLFR